jgi:hypothetical protein
MIALENHKNQQEEIAGKTSFFQNIQQKPTR